MKADDFLKEALGALMDRAASRDVEEERSMARAVRIYHEVRGKSGMDSEADGWMFMICLKLARDAQGKFHADDVVDLAGYAGLYGECRHRENEPSPYDYKHDFPATSAIAGSGGSVTLTAIGDPHAPTEEEWQDMGRKDAQL